MKISPLKRSKSHKENNYDLKNFIKKNYDLKIRKKKLKY